MAARKLNTKAMKDARMAVARATKLANLDPDNAELRRAVVRAKRHYNTVVAEHFIEQIIASAPPLMSADRTRLAALLAPSRRRA